MNFVASPYICIPCITSFNGGYKKVRKDVSSNIFSGGEEMLDMKCKFRFNNNIKGMWEMRDTSHVAKFAQRDHDYV